MDILAYCATPSIKSQLNKVKMIGQAAGEEKVMDQPQYRSHLYRLTCGLSKQYCPGAGSTPALPQ